MIRDIIVLSIGLLVGFTSGAAASWAVAKPLIDAARRAQRATELERRVNSLLPD